MKTAWFVDDAPRSVKRKRQENDVLDRIQSSVMPQQTDFSPLLGSVGVDPEEERDTPKLPTPVHFPDLKIHPTTAWTSTSPPPQLCKIFSKVVKLTDLSHAHIDALNLHISPPCSPEELLPRKPDGSSYIPEVDPAATVPPTTAPPSYAAAAKSDSTAAKRRTDLNDRINELRLDNDLAFRVLTKRLPPDTPPVRVAYTRKFWEGLENMSSYWDTSLDHYYEAPNTDDDPDLADVNKRLRRTDPSPEQSTPSFRHDTPGPWTAESSVETLPTDATDTTRGPTMPQSPDAAISEPNDEENGQLSPHPSSTPAPQYSPTLLESCPDTPPPKVKWRYKGRRTGTGRDMPEQFRVATVTAFMEAVIWPFKGNLAAPRRMPVVQINNLNLPVRQTMSAYQLPTDRLRARQGWLEGPLLGIQVRAETKFQPRIYKFEEDGLDFWEFDPDPFREKESRVDERLAETKARLDLLREIGGLLLLAQERRREGKPLVKPGEGEWWTTKPRWGGGSGESIEEEREQQERLRLAEEQKQSQEQEKQTNVDNADNAEDAMRMGAGWNIAPPKIRRKTPLATWKEIKCGNSPWDPKTVYQAIGRQPGQDYDEIFMVSALNHHISLLKLTVHDRYLEFLEHDRLSDLPDTTAHTPAPPPAHPNPPQHTTPSAPPPATSSSSSPSPPFSHSTNHWSTPHLQRTQWYDLFDPAQRLEAFAALWGVMEYLTREKEAAGGVAGQA